MFSTSEHTLQCPCVQGEEHCGGVKEYLKNDKLRYERAMSTSTTKTERCTHDGHMMSVNA